LIGDLFPASRRAKALSVFMIGLPLGIALSFLGSSLLEHRFGWRFTFYIAAIPGLICALLALLIWEPKRGAAETHSIHAAKRKGSPYLLVLSIPTMWWIIASGAFHNFNMYAIGAFLSPFLQRVHHLNKLNAGMISMVVYGLAGIPGLIVGGMLGDRMMRQRPTGRLGCVSRFSLSALMFIGPTDRRTGRVCIRWTGMASMYSYYATVTRQSRTSLSHRARGTAIPLPCMCWERRWDHRHGFLSNYFTVRQRWQRALQT
jgi:predicted MFS family arabinose efflux permease